MSNDAHFQPALFRFLRELAKNNQRDWFQANKARYEDEVREPLLAFIGAFGTRLKKISAEFMADPRPVGGSLYRIHRDTRFARDKSPYKTHAGVVFMHSVGKKVPAPMFYLHLEPGQVFAGNGMWHPDPPSLAKLRKALIDRPEAWKKAISGKAFRAHCELSGESLSRPPKGFAPDHPLIEDLKRKDFIVVTKFDEAAACAPDFMERYFDSARAAAPFVELLTRAMGLPF